MPKTDKATSTLSSTSPFPHTLLRLRCWLLASGHSEAGGRRKEASTPLFSAGELWLFDAALTSHGAFLLTPMASCADCTPIAASPTIKPWPIARVSVLVTLTSLAARVTASTSSALILLPVKLFNSPVTLAALFTPPPLTNLLLICVWPCPSIAPIAEAMRSGTPAASPASPRAPCAIMLSMVVPSVSVVLVQSPPTSVSTAETTCEMLSASFFTTSAELRTTLTKPSRRAASSA